MTIALSIQDLLQLMCLCTGKTPAYGLSIIIKFSNFTCGLHMCHHSCGMIAPVSINVAVMTEA